MVALSLETERGLRLELTDEVRASPGEGDGGGEDKVVRREEGGLGDDTVDRRVVAVEDSSVVDELALGVLLPVRDAP